MGRKGRIKLAKLFKNKRILITGACGTIGSELFRILCEDYDYDPKEIVGIDNNESALFFMDQQYFDNLKTRFYLADVRDLSKMNRVLNKIDIVFHTAALKHVELCERSPFEAIQSNIHGVQNIIQAALENNVEKVIFTSSDKAVNSTNVMGTSKLMGERLITAANNNHFGSETIFASTRFGNVLGSSGSVIPVFHGQIKNGGPVTLTDDRMTRFVMSINSAAKLVLDSATIAQGGEVFITKMPVIKIADLARVMIEELSRKYGFNAGDIQIKEIGIKPGEKLYEELMSNEETHRAIELEKYFSILPAFRGIYQDIEYNYQDIVSHTVTNPYVSAEEKAISKDELRAFLEVNHLLDTETFSSCYPKKPLVAEKHNEEQ